MKGLSGGFKIAKEAIIQIQKLYNPNFKIKYKKPVKGYKPKTKFFCEPFMGKRNLYPLISSASNNYTKVFELMNFIQYCDGYNTVKRISNFKKIIYRKAKKILKLLKEKKIIS